jgi:lycopene cyclase domain-containing protein
MPATSAYLFLELSILAYVVGFGWENWDSDRIFSRPNLYAACGLATFWFCIDQVAVGLGLWTFPDGATIPVRFLSLPIEEYLLFFLHTLICFLFVGNYARDAA